ncbi:MAG: cation:proton antiporter, partial [Solirubrobacterales bacterium]
MEIDLSNLLVVAGVAVLAPVLADLSRRARLPTVVAEIFLGILVGPELLGLAELDGFLDALSTFGLAFLFFLAGIEIDFERIRGTPLRLGAIGWALSVALAYGIGGLLAAAGVVISYLYTGSAMATTA